MQRGDRHRRAALLGEGPGGVRPSVVTLEENRIGSDSELAAARERKSCVQEVAGCNFFRVVIGIFFLFTGLTPCTYRILRTSVFCKSNSGSTKVMFSPCR